MKLLALIFLVALWPAVYKSPADTDRPVGRGQMPSLAADGQGNLHLVYGTGDSLMYACSTDGGATFGTPGLVAVLPELAASHTRGPQIAVTGTGLLLTACTNGGDIFSYTKAAAGPWRRTGRVNDKDTVAKENLMALHASGNNAFAVWLDLRDGHNKIVGAASADGGVTWGRNRTIYASPDTTVCECCRPSVAMQGREVYVLFRNWLNGNRDMYLVRSADGGRTFSKAVKLGQGTWPLKGCPMDGGGLVLQNGRPQTVWYRQGKIYACGPGGPEQEVGAGRSCTLAAVNGGYAYAWVDNGTVVVRTPDGTRRAVGKGMQPVLRAAGSNQVLCVWEKDKQIHKALVAR